MLDNADFAGIGGVGTLQANYFVQGLIAQDSDDHIIYQANKGKIFYDGDGNGTGSKIWFAKVEPGTASTTATSP